MKRIAVTGLSGVIGTLLSEQLMNDYELVDLYHQNRFISSKKLLHQKLDLLDIQKIDVSLEKAKPDAIIHLAAITHIDRCQKDKEQGKNGVVWKTNVSGTAEIAKFCVKHKIPLIFTSTECVFDGKKEVYLENDKTNPISWYGETKRAAEAAILDVNGRTTIVRSVVAYHRNDAQKTIYGKILRGLQTEKDIAVVSDQFFTPTYTYDIVRAITMALERELTGILHVAPKQILSPYAFAKLIARLNNYDSSSVTRTTIKKLYGADRASLRLKNSCLQGSKSNTLLGFVPQSPKDVLKISLKKEEQ